MLDHKGNNTDSRVVVLSSDALRHRERRLSIQSSQEVILAFMVTVATLDDAPFPIIFIPFIVLLILAFLNRPSKEFLAELKERIRLPRNVLVRHTSGASSKLYSAPFMSILFVPEEKLLSLRRPGGVGELYHELGHRRQYDMTAILWLVLAGVLWGGLFLLSLPQGLTETINFLGGYTDPGSKDHDLFLNPDNEFYPALMMLAMAVIVFSSLRRLLHNREFLADVRGALVNKSAMISFLEEGVREDQFAAKHQSRLAIWLSSLSHPSFARRLRALNVEEGQKATETLVHALIWALSATTVLTFWAVRNFENTIPQLDAVTSPQTSIKIVLAVAGLLICAVGVFMHRTYFKCGHHRPARMLSAQAFGYGLGFIVGLMHFFVFRYATAGDLELSSQELWIGGLLVPSVVLFWLTLNVLTCLAFKSLKQQNYLFFFYSFLNWMAGGGCAMAVLLPFMIEREAEVVPVLISAATIGGIAIGLAALMNFGLSSFWDIVLNDYGHAKRLVRRLRSLFTDEIADGH